MKVAIFTDNDFGKVNGVTTTLRAVLDHAPDDLDLRIYTCEGVSIESPDYLSLAALGIGIPFYREMKVYVPPLRRFLRHAVADGIDLLHFTTPGPVGLAAMWVASRLGLRMIGSFHTDLAEYTRLLSGSKWLGRIMQEYMRWPYGKCERVFAPSDATRDMLIRARINPSRVEIWRRGVSTTRFDPGRRSPALRERWGVTRERAALIYVGRLSREKGLAVLEPLSRHLDYAGVAHRLVFVGDGPMRNELEAACPGAVFTGTLSPDEVAVAMASADIFLFPSRTDTAGNVVLEAQASGLPVLVSGTGGPRENMRPGETGFACDELLDFARRASELVRNADKRHRFSEAARHYALTRRWETALEPLYRSYASASPSPVAPLVGAPGARAVQPSV
jgi:glycosyltransferase involved in cell wall biosynthesis